MIAAEGEEEPGSGDQKTATDPESVKTCLQSLASLVRKSVKRPMSAMIPRAPIGCLAGLDFPARMSVAIENPFAQGSDRVLPVTRQSPRYSYTDVPGYVRAFVY